MKSPLSGKEMKLISETLPYFKNGEYFNLTQHYYLCELTNTKFTTTELDEKNSQEISDTLKLYNI